MIPFPFTMIFSSIYINTFSWSTHPISNCLPALVTNVICVGSYVNSRKDLFIIIFASPKQDSFKIVNIRRISKRISIEQDLGIIKKKARLYIYILLMLISNRTGLSTLPLIYQKNTL
jgi:hypothetical protein